MNNGDEVELPNISSAEDNEFVPVEKKREDKTPNKIYFCFLKYHYYFRFVNLYEINMYFLSNILFFFSFCSDRFCLRDFYSRGTNPLHKWRDGCINLHLFTIICNYLLPQFIR